MESFIIYKDRPLILLGTLEVRYHWVDMDTFTERKRAIRNLHVECIDVSGNNIYLISTEDGKYVWYFQEQNYNSFEDILDLVYYRVNNLQVDDYTIIEL